MLEGIDVSAWQAAQDWAAHARGGLAFAFAKATEGLGYRDPTYPGNIVGIRGAGLTRGSYHFGHPPGDAAKEVAYYLAYADPGPGHIIALDLEVGLEASGGGAALGAWKDAWLAAAKAARPANRVILYCNASYWRAMPGSNCGDGLWIAEYGVAQPTIVDAWRFWQYTDSGGMDRDRGNFATPAALHAWAAGGAP